jgi:hypothetical protein
MTKTLNHIIFFPSPKSEYFFQQHRESEYFFRKKPITPPPPLQVKWSVPYKSQQIGTIRKKYTFQKKCSAIRFKLCANIL